MAARRLRDAGRRVLGAGVAARSAARSLQRHRVPAAAARHRAALYAARRPSRVHAVTRQSQTSPLVRNLRPRYTYGEVTSQNLWPRYDRHFVDITCVELSGEDLSCYLNNIRSVGL